MEPQISVAAPAETEAPILLTPDNIAEMLRRRESYQVAKFRTTCSDCVPNL